MPPLSEKRILHGVYVLVNAAVNCQYLSRFAR